jgi:hypothetical protein
MYTHKMIQTPPDLMSMPLEPLGVCRNLPVVDAIPPSSYPSTDCVTVYPCVLIPVLPPAEEEVVEDTLEHGHHNLSLM